MLACLFAWRVFRQNSRTGMKLFSLILLSLHCESILSRLTFMVLRILQCSSKNQARLWHDNSRQQPTHTHTHTSGRIANAHESIGKAESFVGCLLACCVCRRLIVHAAEIKIEIIDSLINTKHINIYSSQIYASRTSHTLKYFTLLACCAVFIFINYLFGSK